MGRGLVVLLAVVSLLLGPNVAVPPEVAAAPVTTVAPSAAGASRAAAAAVLTPQQAVDIGVASAASFGVTQYVSVVDRRTGQRLARSGNGGEQVASESVMKAILAAYYLVIHGGPASTPPDLLSRLSFIVRASDNPTTSALFTANAIPFIATRYGLTGTTNAVPAGRWGAARITADDMATFLWRAEQDPLVGPWLIPTMAAITDLGAGDNFDQRFGLNAILGERGAKQGWGGDTTWRTDRWTINSIGYTDRYHVALLSTSTRYADPARSTLTDTARVIQASRLPIVNGEFVVVAGRQEVYRIAGGAPLYVPSWAAFGGPQRVRTISDAEMAGLRPFPANGTFITAGPYTYRIAGGAPIFVPDWSIYGGPQPSTVVHPDVVTHAGKWAPWNNLRARPANGTFLTAGPYSYRIAGGAPLFVPDWSVYGGVQPAVRVHPDVVTHAGKWAPWNNLSSQPADGTFLTAGPYSYRIAGGAPIFVPDWSTYGGVQPTIRVHPDVVTHAGKWAPWNNLRYQPADGTVLSADNVPYYTSGGAPVRIWSWEQFGGYRPTIVVHRDVIAHAGKWMPWDHLAAPR